MAACSPGNTSRLDSTQGCPDRTSRKRAPIAASGQRRLHVPHLLSSLVRVANAGSERCPIRRPGSSASCHSAHCTFCAGFCCARSMFTAYIGSETATIWTGHATEDHPCMAKVQLPARARSSRRRRRAVLTPATAPAGGRLHRQAAVWLRTQIRANLGNVDRPTALPTQPTLPKQGTSTPPPHPAAPRPPCRGG